MESCKSSCGCMAATCDNLEFKDITLADRAWMEPILRKANLGSEEFSFTFTYIWRNAFGFKAARYKDFLIIRWEGKNRPASYLFPVGEGDVSEVVDALLAECERRDCDLRFNVALPHQLQQLVELYGDRLESYPITDYWDYVYDAQSLITLAGKKLHAKRNHINRFKENNPDWSYEVITEENLPEVIEMCDAWFDMHDEQTKTLLDEAKAVRAAIKDYFALGLDGGAIRAGGRIVAFSMGDSLNDETYLLHFEKAYADIQGAYAIINQEFAAHNCQGFRYINREDDSGELGLRKAKESYRPVFMMEKHAAILTV